MPGRKEPRARKLDPHDVAVGAHQDARNLDGRQLAVEAVVGRDLGAGLRLGRGGPGFDPLVVRRRLLLDLGQLRRGAAELIAERRDLVFEQARLLLRLAEHRLQLLIILVERQGAHDCSSVLRWASATCCCCRLCTWPCDEREFSRSRP